MSGIVLGKGTGTGKFGVLISDIVDVESISIVTGVSVEDTQETVTGGPMTFGNDIGGS